MKFQVFKVSLKPDFNWLRIAVCGPLQHRQHCAAVERSEFWFMMIEGNSEVGPSQSPRASPPQKETVEQRIDKWPSSAVWPGPHNIIYSILDRLELWKNISRYCPLTPFKLLVGRELKKILSRYINECKSLIVCCIFGQSTATTMKWKQRVQGKEYAREEPKCRLFYFKRVAG